MKNEKGIALPLVLMIILVLSLLGTALWYYSVNDTIQVAKDEKGMQAYYLARSGVDTAANYIMRHPDDIAALDGKTSALTNLGTGTFAVTVNKLPDYSVKITAEGTVNDNKKSATLTLLPLNLSDIFNRAIFSTSTLDITGMKVTGDVESNGSVIYTTDSNSTHTYTGNVIEKSNRVFAIPTFPTNLPPQSDITISQNTEAGLIENDGEYNNISVKNGSLTFKADGKVLKIMVNTLDVTSNLNIETMNNGRVELYINNDAHFTSNGVINNNNANNLFIFLQAGGYFEVQSGAALYAYIYGPEATVEVQSGNSVINGGIVANILVKNQQLQGPNGTLNYIKPPDQINLSYVIGGYRKGYWSK